MPLVPQKASIPKTEPPWQNILAYDGAIGKSIFFRLKVMFSNFLILRRFLVSLGKSESIFFVESFDVEDFASLLLALFFIRPPIHIWILHRYVFDRSHKKTLIFRSFHWCFEKLIGKKNVRYLTDSELLAREQQKVYGRIFSVVPIPHGHDSSQAVKMQGDELLLWWPGGAVREEKGLSHIQRIARMIEGKENVRLVIAESAKRLLLQHSRIHFIPTEIAREEYVHWMNRAGLVLLPYSSNNYAFRTSGIFVEAVSMGAIPVVSQQTWMAYELKKFDLDELAIDWNQEKLIDLLRAIRSNDRVLAKLEQMSAFYRDFHSEEKFGEVFAQIANS